MLLLQSAAMISILRQPYIAASIDVGGRYPHLAPLLPRTIHGASYWAELSLRIIIQSSIIWRVQSHSMTFQ